MGEQPLTPLEDSLRARLFGIRHLGWLLYRLRKKSSKRGDKRFSHKSNFPSAVVVSSFLRRRMARTMS
jgi:hypothetical protein